MSKITPILKKNSMIIALVVVTLLFQVLITVSDKGSLFTPSNVTNLIAQNSYVVILAVGMLLCILTGGNIDLSVGSVVALVGAVAGTLICNMGVNIYVAIIISLLVGILIGVIQGFWIAYARIPAFIVTLAGMMLWRGLALIILNGLTISPFPEDYLVYFTSFIPGGNNPDPNAVLMITMVIGAVICLAYIVLSFYQRAKRKAKDYEVESMTFLAVKMIILTVLIIGASYLLGQNKGTPVVLILIAAVIMIYAYFTQNTVPGRYLYAMGGNEKASQLSGINTNKTLFFAYVNMSFLAAVAALVCIARFNSAAPAAGTGYELDAIGACFIGGASAYGGTGTVGGSVIGAVFMGVLNNGMSILGIDANWQRAVKGVVLLAAVVFDVLSKKRAVKS